MEAGGEEQQRLRLALNFPPSAGLSPYTDDSALLTRMGAAESLVVFDDQGLAQPQLAESWEFTDDRTVSLELRDDVVFHDGTPMDAAAVAGALTNAAAAQPTPRVLKGVGITARAVDEDTVELRAAQDDPLLVQRLGAASLVVLSPAAYADPAAPDPVGHGTGPFQLTAVDGASTATLDAYDSYWGGAPALDGVDVRFVSDPQARTSALRAGDVDVAQALPIAQLPLLGADDQVQVVPLPRVVGAYLNTARGPFTDAGLRSAAFAAIDPAAVVDGPYEGQADLATGFLNAATLDGLERPEVQRAPATDPVGASIRLATYSDRPELPEAAAVVAEQLRGAGFTVEVVVQEYTTLEPALLAGEFDAVLATRLYLLDSGDPIGFFATDVTCAGSYNLARLCDPVVDAAVAAASPIADPVERREAAVALEAQVLGTGSFVPLLHERSRIGAAPGVSRLSADPFERQVVTVDTTLR